MKFVLLHTLGGEQKGHHLRLTGVDPGAALSAAAALRTAAPCAYASTLSFSAVGHWLQL